MKRILLAGRTGVGKTSFCQALNGMQLQYKKTQAIEILHNAIDTPGEYLENRSLYRALIVTSADADLIVLLQDCTDEQTVFAPGFASMFGKPTIGLVTKTDLANDRQLILDAKERLLMAGCEQVYEVSNLTGEGIPQLRTLLEM